jgi:hypothetical protein
MHLLCLWVRESISSIFIYVYVFVVLSSVYLNISMGMLLYSSLFTYVYGCVSLSEVCLFKSMDVFISVGIVVYRTFIE